MNHALLVLAALLASSGPAAAPVRVGPPGAWVERLTPDLALPTPPEAGRGMHYLLLDDQVRTGPGPLERFHRRAIRLLTPTGVANGAEVRVDYDPACQAVTLHEVTIHRQGRRIDALRPGEIKLLQRETDLDRRLYDGRITAVLFLRDVREGDVVESAFTVRGANPVLGGRWSERFGLGYSEPVGHRNVRVVGPPSRQSRYRVTGMVLEPERTRSGEAEALRWSRTLVAATAEEADVPPGAHLFPAVEISEWSSWREVEEWALPLYEPGVPAASVLAKAATWRHLLGPRARAQAALRFVQDEIRYLGLELGENSHRPQAPPEVMARRSGDCKDKSLLLVALLRAMGIAAWPALVHTEEEASVEARLPSPIAFDHVIVRLLLDGKEHWVDPTRSLERSPLDALEPPPFGRALVLGAGQGSLVAIPEPAPAALEVVRTYRVPRFGAPVQLEVRTTLVGRRAVTMRHRLAESSRDEIQRHYLEYQARRDARVKLSAQLEIDDAPDADKLVLLERYELPPVADGEELFFASEGIRPELDPPGSTFRRMPLRLTRPAEIQERVRVELPGPPNLSADEVSISGGAARLTRRARAEGNRYLVDMEYRTLQRVIPAAEVPRHADALRQMREVASFSLNLAVRRGGVLRPSGWAEIAIFAALLLSAGTAIIAVVAASNGDLRRWMLRLESWRRARAFRARFRAAAGETPEKPVPIATAADMAAAAARLRCGCGGALPEPTEPAEPVRYGDRKLLVWSALCPSCGQTHRTYFAPGA